MLGIIVNMKGRSFVSGEGLECLLLSIAMYFMPRLWPDVDVGVGIVQKAPG
jgi:hypothetical protein